VRSSIELRCCRPCRIWIPVCKCFYHSEQLGLLLFCFVVRRCGIVVGFQDDFKTVAPTRTLEKYNKRSRTTLRA
jgi:hypothetical protein